MDANRDGGIIIIATLTILTVNPMHSITAIMWGGKKVNASLRLLTIALITLEKVTLG